MCVAVPADDDHLQLELHAWVVDAGVSRPPSPLVDVIALEDHQGEMTTAVEHSLAVRARDHNALVALEVKRLGQPDMRKEVDYHVRPCADVRAHAVAACGSTLYISVRPPATEEKEGWPGGVGGRDES